VVVTGARLISLHSPVIVKCRGAKLRLENLLR
jgi:hypothetical protein